MSFVQRKSKISIQKNPSEHPQKCRGWYVWAWMQRPSKTEEQSPKFKIFNVIGNKRSRQGKQTQASKQAGSRKNPKTKNKPVIHGCQTRGNARELRHQNTKTIWKGTRGRVGLNTLGNKVQVSHISSQLRLETGTKQGRKTDNNTREERTFKLKQNPYKIKQHRL